jgi:hypothetical protein
LKSIGAEAFAESGLTEITIPEQIFEIGDKAFYACHFLHEVNFSSNYSLKSICKSAFAESGLLSIYVPSSVSYIGDSCFSDCELLTNILFICQSQLQKICAETFRNTNANVFYLPDSVEILGSESFSECKNLVKVICSEGSRLKIIDAGAFNSSTIESFEIPDSVQYISSYAFCDCPQLKTLQISPNSQLQQIGRNAFYFSYLTNDEEMNFESAVIPRFVKRIGSYAFSNAKSLKQVSFDSRSELAVLGYDAFSFTGLTKITIPRSVEKIGNYCFSHTALTSVRFEDESRLKSIGAEAFAFSWLESISLPVGLTRLKSLCFNNCENLVSAIIQSSANSVSEFSLFPDIFKNCNPLLVVHIPLMLTNSKYWKDDMLNQYFQNDTEHDQFGMHNSSEDQSLYHVIDETIANSSRSDVSSTLQRILNPTVTIAQFFGHPNAQIVVR